MMVRFTLDNCAGPVELLGKDQAHHLVGEGHLREGELLVGTGIDTVRKSVRATNDEDQPTGSLLLLREPAGKVDAAQFDAVFVEQNHGIGRLQLLEYQLALHRLLLLLREILGIAELGDCDYVEGHVVANALGIVADARLKVLVGSLAYEYEVSLHSRPCAWGSWETSLS